jgi:hypothetical protein
MNKLSEHTVDEDYGKDIQFPENPNPLQHAIEAVQDK